MLGAYRIEGVSLYHRRQIALFEHPDSIGSQAGGDAGDKCVRVRQVIEHRYASYYPRTTLLHGSKAFNAEEYRRLDNTRLVILTKCGDCGIHSDPRDPWSRIRVQKCTIVAADIEDNISGIQRVT